MSDYGQQRPIPGRRHLPSLRALRPERRREVPAHEKDRRDGQRTGPDFRPLQGRRRLHDRERSEQVGEVVFRLLRRIRAGSPVDHRRRGRRAGEGRPGRSGERPVRFRDDDPLERHLRDFGRRDGLACGHDGVALLREHVRGCRDQEPGSRRGIHRVLPRAGAILRALRAGRRFGLRHAGQGRSVRAATRPDAPRRRDAARFLRRRRRAHDLAIRRDRQRIVRPRTGRRNRDLPRVLGARS